MVLWNKLGRDREVALRKCGRPKRKKVRRSERGRGRRGFKPDAAAGSTRKPGRNHIRLRGVGFQQYRKSAGFAQGGAALQMLMAGVVKTASLPRVLRSRS